MYIRNATILDKDFKYRKVDLAISERIESIVPVDEGDGSGHDFEGDILIPGLVDIHTHGALGMDSMSENLDMDKWRKYLLFNGVTTFFPTTVTEDRDRIESCIDKLSDADGIYLEGPYINAKKRGAHDEGKIRKIDMDLVEKIAGKLNFITIAPEFEENMQAIPKLTDMGIRVSLGHSTADYDTAQKAFDMGATQLVHTFNAMSPLGHREPNLVGAALDDERIFCEVISDGVHLHPAIVRILSKILGPKRMLLMSDSMAATGLEDGEYILGGLKVIVKDAVARTEYGAIAGSTKNLMQMMQSAVSFGVPFEKAVEMATLTPARAAGIQGDVGSIEEGKIANMVRLGKDNEIKAVIYKGENIPFGNK